MVFPIGGVISTLGAATGLVQGVGGLINAFTGTRGQSMRPAGQQQTPAAATTHTSGAPAPTMPPSGPVQVYVNGRGAPGANGQMPSGIVPRPAVTPARWSPWGIGQGSAPDVIAVGTGGRIRPIIAKARAYTGVPMTSRKIVGLVRQFGWMTVADWTGLGIEELLIVYTYVTRRKRTRWTSRDKSRARRYIGMLERASREYSKLRGRTAPRRRSGSGSRANVVNVK